MRNDASEVFCAACMLEGALKLGEEFSCSGELQPVGSLPRLGDYQLLDEIGRGGMGVVYRAHQTSLNRIVSVKLILIGQFADQTAIKRFKAEASAAAKLRHPNIVAIHEIGEEFGQHFFSMEYIEGQNLADLLRQQPISTRQAAQLLKKIAEAVHYAHEHGIIHRDLKPSNILIDALYEPHIADFGLARDVKSEADLTLTGQVLGSPNYISPEQASGHAAVSVLSDIYSLGAILYHLLTGRPPFAAETLTATLQQVTTVDPVSPGLLNPSVPRDLETICLKCLEKEPPRRYPNAAAVAAELTRFLNDEPTCARPISPPAKAWRWCRRKPVVAALTAGFALSLLLGFIGVAWQWQRAERNLYFSTMRRVQNDLEQQNVGYAKILLEKYIPKWWERDLRGWEWYYAWDQCQSDELFSLTNKSWIHSVAISPDGTLLAAGGKGVTLWDTQKKEMILEMDTNVVLNPVVFSNGGKEIIGGTWDGRVFVWNIETRQTKIPLTNLTYVRSLKLSPNGKFLAIYAHSGVTLWKVENYERIKSFSKTSGSDNLPGGIAFSSDSSMLAYSDEGGKIVLWDIEKRSETAVLEGHELNVTSLVFSLDGSILVSGSRDRTVRVWEVKTGKLVKTIVGFVAFVKSMDLSSERQLLAVVGAGHYVQIFDTVAWQQINQLAGHTAPSRTVIFSPDGKQIVSADFTGAVRFWPATRANYVSQRFPASWAELLQGGRGLYLEHTEASYSFWPTESSNSTPPKPFPFRDSGIQRTMSPDGTLWATATTNEVKIFNHGTHDLTLNLPLSSTNGAQRIIFSADSQLLAVCGKDVCQVWKLILPTATGRRASALQLGKFPLRSTPVQNIKFSPKNRLFGVAYESGEIADVWNIGMREKIELRVPHGKAVDFAFFRDESMALTTLAGGALAVWDLKSGRMITFLGGQLGTLWSVDFSPDETRIAACGGDGTVRIWDRATLEEVAVLKLHNERLFWIAFSETGETLFTLGPDISGGYRLFSLRAPKATASKYR